MIRFLRYPLAASMLALILSYWLAGGQARGQTTGTATSTSTPVPATPTPTATATATPSIPSGQDLFARMTAAIVAKNTYHLTLHLTEAVPSSLRVVISSQADFSNKPRMERVVETTTATQLTTKPAKTTTQHEQIILVKKKAAAKIGKQAWSCTSGTIATPQVNLQSAVDLGPETVGAIAVWHVKVVATVNVSGRALPVTAHYYIAQADFTLVRATVSDTVTTSGVTVKVTSDEAVTKYGEKVSVKLPAACKGKSVSSDTAENASAMPGGLPELALVARNLAQTASIAGRELNSGR